ncbi:MAG: hypothetical protein NTZ44_01140 [Candidatus Nomurabacteria bacterium]|nr:hypothetical protein [Candidatus Nomurabacteria bacterium]
MEKPKFDDVAKRKIALAAEIDQKMKESETLEFSLPTLIGKDHDDQEESLKSVKKQIKKLKAEQSSLLLGDKQKEAKRTRTLNSHEAFNDSVIVEKEVELLTLELNLTKDLPKEFQDLQIEQKLFALQNLKKRVVDIVKSEAETQYSEYLKTKIGGVVSSDSKLKNLANKIKMGGVSLVETTKKITELKDLETEIFKELRETEEGEQLITEDLSVLSNMAKERTLFTTSKNGEQNQVRVSYHAELNIQDRTPEEDEAVSNFNWAANKFREMPDEWGQAEAKSKWVKWAYSGNREKYEKAKAEYETAKAEILNIKIKRELPDEKGKSMLEVGILDNQIKMDQLMNTHPEFQKEIDQLGADASAMGWVKTVSSKIFSSKGFTNVGLAGLGFGTRMMAKGAAFASGSTIITAVAAPVIGGVLGGIRGKIRGQSTLAEKQMKARHGQKDESAEAQNTVDAKNLVKKLEDLSRKLEQVQNDPNAVVKMVKGGDIIEIDGKRMKVASVKSNGEVTLFPEDEHVYEKKLPTTYPNLGTLKEQAEWLFNNKVDLFDTDGNKEEIESADDIYPYMVEQFENSSKVRVDKIPTTFGVGEDKTEVEMLAILEANLVDQIKRRVEYTQDKITDGRVNFGEAKSAFNNQLNLITGINNALVHAVSMEKSVREDIDARLAKLLSYKEKQIDEAQEKFIKKQIKTGMIVGATASTLGYGVRWFGETMGWWGGHAENAVAGANVVEKEEVVKIVNENTPADTSEGFMTRTGKWLGEMWDKISGVEDAKEAKIHAEEAIKEATKIKNDSIAHANAEAIAKVKAQLLKDSTDTYNSKIKAVSDSTDAYNASEAGKIKAVADSTDTYNANLADEAQAAEMAEKFSGIQTGEEKQIILNNLDQKNIDNLTPDQIKNLTNLSGESVAKLNNLDSASIDRISRISDITKINDAINNVSDDPFWQKLEGLSKEAQDKISDKLSENNVLKDLSREEIEKFAKLDSATVNNMSTLNGPELAKAIDEAKITAEPSTGTVEKVAAATTTGTKTAEKVAEAVATEAKEAAGPRGAQIDFSVTLGKNGVPPNLETAFNEIAADKMPLPESGIIDEQFATKSLNTAANLVQLTEGNSVAGVDAQEFAKAVSFKGGILEIKDHEKFNEILEKLSKHSDELWDKGALQGKGAAISYIDKISPKSWLKIMHADGLHELPDEAHTPTGIIGHEGITAENIKDFHNSEMVQKAIVLEQAEVDNYPADEEQLAFTGEKYTPESEFEYKAPVENVKAEDTGFFDKATKEMSDQRTAIERNVTPDATPSERVMTMNEYADKYNKAPKVNPADHAKDNTGSSKGGAKSGATVETTKGLKVTPDENNHFGVKTDDLSKHVLPVNHGNIEELKTLSKSSTSWKNIRGVPAKTFLAMNKADLPEKWMVPYYEYLHKMKDLTGLEPRGESASGKPPITVEQYMQSGLEKAYSEKGINGVPGHRSDYRKLKL